MKNHSKTAIFIALLLVLFSLSTLVPFEFNRALAAQRTLSWTVVNTPDSGPTNVIVSPCEINAIAIAPDDLTIYCVDTSQSKIYKSMDEGYTWRDITDRLAAAAGTPLTIWDIAVAPDNNTFVMAITGNATSGPQKLYYSGDVGANWHDCGFPILHSSEYIRCLDISIDYGASDSVRDVAVGTSSVAGPGYVYTRQYSTSAMSTWSDNTSPLATPQSFSSIKFSPNYDTDSTIAVISSDNTSTTLSLGKHVSATNTINWNSDYASYPITIGNDIIVSNRDKLIRSTLELPSDFFGDLVTDRACFASILTDNSSAVLYLNANLYRPDYRITPNLTGNSAISSIAYYGSLSSGILLAGDNTTVTGSCMTSVWQCSNPQTTTPGGATWVHSTARKSPTGGANSGRANAILKWSRNGERAYCGTSSENCTLGGASENSTITYRWPFGKTIGQFLDESAFSRSLDNGLAWNQTGLIDTEITLLSDSAAHEVPEGAESTTQTNILYLASINENASTSLKYNFDSVWRSITSPVGEKWERILTDNTSDVGTVLRINPRGDRVSSAVVFADLSTEKVTYSGDTGQTWEPVQSGINVTDICLTDDSTIYVLSDYVMCRATHAGTSWLTGPLISTNLETPAHTICAPLINAAGTGSKAEEIVIVGTEGPGDSYVAWIDLSKFNPEFEKLKTLPQIGDVHVMMDSQFNVNRTIYAALCSPSGSTPNPSQGGIFRWKLGTSEDWDNLQPLNLAFYGIETLNDVLYGAWNYDTLNIINKSGADRTLYPLVSVPPPPEWDQLVTGLPTSFNVSFTREPTSLHISSSTYNTLWAIDNQAYDFTGKKGCLWMYVDSASRIGPWPISPPTGSYIGADPVTGRSQQIDFKWRQIKEMIGYDLLIAKDVDFTLPLSQNLNFVTTDNGTRFRIGTDAWVIDEVADWQDPGVWLEPGLLETGRTYYWKVRGSRAFTDNISMPNIIHTPWSSVMFFTVKPGFTVGSFHPGPALLNPINGPCAVCRPPVGFSWTPIKEAAKYEFVLAADPEMKNVVIRAYTTAPSYYADNLEYFKPYYWKVRASAPIPSDFSPVATFSLTGGSQISPVSQAVRMLMPGVPGEMVIWIMIGLAYLLILLVIIYAFVSSRG